MKSHLLHHIKAGLLFVFAMVLTLTVSATVFNVNTTNDTHAVNPAAGTGLDASGNISFRSALEAANAVGGTHTVNLQGLTYNLTLGEITIGDFTQNITINGITAASTIVNMTNTNRDRILFINSTGTNPNITTVINNVQFTNGQLNTDTYGGGAIIAGGPNNSLTLNSCIFSGNSIGATGTAATQGGAVRYNGGGSLTIDNCTFSNNSNSKSDGGAVSYFLENLAGAGNGAVTITNSTFNNNSVTANGGNGGGAIHVAAQGRITAGITFTVNILRNTFTSNSASGTSGVGGAIRTINSFDVGNTMAIQYNRFVNNTATLAPSALAMSSAQGNVNATDNWWGCNTGPSAAGTCDRAAITGSGGVGTLNTATWLQLKLTAATSPVCYTSGTSVVTASFLTNSAGTSISLANLVRVIGLPITFSATLGTLSGAQPNITAAGTATVTYTAGATGGTGTVNGVVDNVPAAETTPARASIVINKPVVTNPGVTTGTAGTAFSQTFTASGGSTPYTFSTSSTLPAGLTLSAAGVLSGTPTVVGTFPIVVNVTDNLSCTGTGTTYNLVISCQTITVTNPGTTTGTVGTAFSQTFTQTSAIGGATFSLFSGTLPTGLTLSAAGVLSGTPTQSGTFPIVVRVTDGNNCTGNGPTYNLVISCQTITVTNPGVATGTNGTAFSQTFTQSGAIGGATFSVFSGTLPNGLTLSAAGVLSGTPSAPAGTYPIVVRATDGNGCFGNGATYNLVISCQAISVTNPAVTTGQTGIPFSQTFTQTGGIGTTNFSLFSGSLPAGLTLSAAGVLSGTPTATGTFNIVVRATDANGCFGNGATYTLVITSCPIVDQTVTASPTSVCTGTGSTVTVAATQPGINYTLRIDPSNVVVSGPTTGTGAALNFPTGNLSSNTTFNVLAETDSNSVYLNGGQSGFAIPQNAALDVTNNFTIEGWIKPDGDPDFGRLFNKDGSYALGVSSNQTQLTFTRHSAGDFSRPFTFVNGQWYHIACTYVSGTVELFVNGTSIGTVGGVPAINVTSSGGHIGSDAGGNFNQFRGNIDNVRIWNSVRTQAQIAANQLSFLTSTGNPTLVASWWISEGSGNAKDYSSNAINSTGLVGVWQGVSPVPYCNLVLTNKPTVTVIPNNSITLTSAAGTDAQTVCINTPIVNITYSTVSATGATFSGLPAGVTGNWAANVVTISGTPTSSVGSPFSYTVTLTGGCGPTTTANGTITVTPNNTITLTSAAGTNAQTVCINTPITNITYSTTGATGATFSGLPAGVTGNWAANVVTISGTPTSSVGSPFSYTVTLTGGCGTITATGTITVTPNNTITLTSAAGTNAQTVCLNTPITNITYSTTGATGATFSGLPAGVTGNWAANVVTISGTPTSAAGSPFSYTVTLTGGCGTITANGTITVNPIPTVNAVSNQVVCNGAPTATVTFSGAVPGTVYNWTNNTTSIGLGASGSGNIASFNGINAGTAPVTATITVTPSYTNNGVTCTGTPTTFTITVNPGNTVTQVASQTVCNGSATTAINFSSTATGGTVVYNWTGTVGTIGLPTSGSGNIASFTAINTGTTVVSDTIKVTADYTNGGTTCTSPVMLFVITVNPTPTVNTVTDQTVCTGTPTAAVNFSGAVTGTVYNWTNNTTSIGLGASGTGNIPSFTATNATAAPVTATVTVTPVFYNQTIQGSLVSGDLTMPSRLFRDGVPGSCPTKTFPGTSGGAHLYDTYTFVNTTGQNQCVTISYAAKSTGDVFVAAYNGSFNPAALSTNYMSDGGTSSIGGSVTTFSVNVNAGATLVLVALEANSAPCPNYVISVTGLGTSCTGTPRTFNITVNPTPTVNTVANQVVCNGAPTAAVNFTGATTGTVYNWTNNTPSIGLAASGSGNIASFNAINTGTAPVTATITVTPSYTNGGTTCTGTPTTFTITVNPTPTVNSVGNQVVCNGAPTTAVTFSGTVPGTVYNWTNNTPSIGLAASGTGNIASFNAINTGNAPVTATITVTPSYTNAGTTCTGTPTTFTITVNPTPTVNTVANQVVCNGAPTAAVNFSGAVAGTVYSWTNNTTSIGLAASGTGNIASFNAINTGTAPVTATITVTPSYTNGGTTCTGTSTTFTITVNPTPTVNAVANQVVCNGAPTAAVTFSGSVPGTVYNWTNNTTSIGLAASGTGNIASFNAINTGTAPVTATITVTPSYTNGGTTCTGTPTTFTITVNPTPTVNAVANQVVCNGAPTTAVNFSGAVPGTVYNWTNNTPSIGLAASGTGNIASFNAINAGTNPVTATITVTPTYTNGGTTCTGTSTTFTITVNPTPTVNAVANQVVCNGAPTTAVTFTGAVSGTVFNWTNNTTSIGLAASGTGNIASFTATNATNAPVVATITVTPSYTNGGTTCTGTPRTFTITVNPTPVVNSVPNQVICNAAPTTAVNFSSPTTGGTIVYNWTNNTPSIGLAASGSGNIASFTATNATNAPVTATITVIASYTNGGTTCTSAPVTFTITVNPTPIVNNVSNQVVCNGEMTADVFFSSPTTGGTIVYNWTNNTTSIGLAASGTGNIPAFTATNATNAPVTATITVIASYTNGGTTCTSAPRTFTITVNPTPVVNSVPNQTVCNGAPTTAVNFSSPTTGGTIVYNWTNSTPSIGLAASGSGNIASFNAVNATNAPVTATITVIASYTNGGTTCSSAPVTFTITVNPTPVVNSVANQVVCNGAPTVAVNFTSPTTGGTIVYNWTNNTLSIGLAASGSGDIASFNAVNATNAPITATITVTASYTNGGTTCTSAPVTFTITVNPTPTVNAVANQTVCNNSATAAVTFTGSVAGTVYNWTNNNTSIGLAASGTGNIASFTATNATNAPVTATITVTPSYTNGGTTCTGASRTFTITVNPTPNVNPVANQTVCNGAATPAINFNGTVAGTVYSWTNNTTSIGLAASGTGNIASFTAINTGTTPVTATITVTPSYTNGGTTCTGTPITFTITVNPSTVITANPTSQTICAGGNVTFTGAATGLGLSYQWQVNTGSGFTNVTNGGVYSGATTASLTITGATAGMNGYQYRLEVTGTCGVQNTTAATLTVNTPPNITTHPANTAACVGANTSFTVVATGTGLTYQWQLSTAGAGGPFTNITNGGVYGGATTATLTITGVTAAMNNYRYQVVISGTCPPTPVTSNQAVLTVNNPVVITQQPASITICFGGSPTFTVAATGTGITYQWQVNTGSGFVNIPGATSASYTVPNPTVLFSFYQYRAVVTGTCNTVISNTATLIVFGLPNINFAKVPPRVCLTDTIVTLKAEPAGGTWTGRGVTGDKFSATAAGTGVSTLTYTVVNANGCISIENYNITVNDCKERHQKLQDALRIYPNPSNGRFNIGFFSDNYKEFNLRVIDARGAVVRDMRFTGLVYGSVIPMDLTSLGSGMYILEAYNTQERASYRIVLTR